MTDKAISPVIGIILMVAVTLALVGLATFTVLNLSDETGSSDVPDSSVKATQTSGGLQATVLKDSNVDEFVVQGPDGKEVSLDSSTGSVKTIGDGAGQYNVIAITDDGSSQVVTTTDIEEGTDAATARTATFTQEGSVNINPPISNAIVKSTEDGITMDVTQTDSSGEFSIGASEDSNITVVVKGFTFTTSGSTKVLYASAQKRSDRSSSLNFNFEESSAYNVNINGEDLLISYNSDSSVKEIATAEQLQAINKITNGLSFDYEILNDINFDDSGNINQFDPLGSESDPFTGSISGNDHTIKNLKISQSSENNTGLISYSSGANIQSMSLRNPDIDGNHSTGVLVGNATTGTTIKNIDINGGKINAEGRVGGVVGVILSGSTITKSSSSTTVISNNDNAGGLVGYSTTQIKQSYSSGSVSGSGDIGGLVGDGESVTNSYATGDVTGSGDHVGGLVGDGEDASDSYATGDVEGVGDVGGLLGEGGEVTNSYAEGDVTGSGDSVGGLVGDGEDASDSYTTGDVEGVGDVGGLLGETSFGTVTDSYATGNVTGTEDDIGGLVGDGEDASDSYATGDVEGVGDVGGLLGEGGEVTNSYATGNVTGTEDDIGGLVGDGDDASGSYATGEVEGAGDVGGLVGGTSFGTVTDSYATGNVTGTEDDIGGLVGDGDDASGSNATGDVEGAGDVGGLLGDGGEVTNSYATGNVTGTEDDIGGLVGDGDDASGSNATGDVEGVGDVGGLLGDGGEVTNSYATGNVTGTGNNVGGLSGGGSDITSSYAIGDVEGVEEVGGLVGDGDDIEDSYATGDVTGSGSEVGGLAGHNFGVVRKTYAEGDVNGNNEVGGLIGRTKASVKNSYSEGIVSGNNKVGGLIGLNYGNINNSYTISDVNGDNKVGGLIGQNGKDAFSNGNKVFFGLDGLIKNLYWNKEVSVNSAIGKEGGSDIGSVTGGDSIKEGVISGLTTSEMQGSSSSSNMNALDFNSNWTTVSGDYPELQD